MGDLVRSEAAPSTPRLHALFNEAVRAVNRRRRSALASPLTITLGDEFQGLAKTLEAGLSVIRTVRTRLREEDMQSRFVLGLIALEPPLNPKKAWNMMGPGLSDAREKLADKRHPSVYRFSLPRDPVLETLLDAVGYAVSEVEAGWTERQREIVAASLASTERNVDLAESLGITERTLYKIRNAARLDFYKEQWSAIEVAVSDLDQRYGLA